MNLPFFIARRYFLSSKKKTFINVIAIISMVVVGLSTMAMVIVLSVFNGLEGLLRNLYGSFDPQITISPAEGKSFVYTPDLRDQILEVSGVTSLTDVIEDNVLIKYRNAQRVVRLKGVGDSFLSQDRFRSAIAYGPMELKRNNVGYAIVGRGIQYEMNIQINDDFYPLQVYYPRDVSAGQLNPERMFILRHILPGSVFAVEKYIDENYIFVPIEFSVDLLNYGNKRTSLELAINDQVSQRSIMSTLSASLGQEFSIRSNEQMHGGLYRILQWEKIFVFLTFAAIIAIGSINIYFSLSMLVIDKKKDLSVLKSIGASATLIKKLFLFEGILIAFTGSIVGLVLGLIVSFLQQEYGLVSIGVPGALSEAYPVKIEALDVLFASLFVILITFTASIQPARKGAKALELHLLQ